jgi:hypothetical protein
LGNLSFDGGVYDPQGDKKGGGAIETLGLIAGTVGLDSMLILGQIQK